MPKFATSITSGGHTWSLNVSLIGGSSGGPVTIDVLIEAPHLSGTKTCALEGTTDTQTSTVYDEASWKSSKQFVASTILTGTLKAATTGSAEFVNVMLTK